MIHSWQLTPGAYRTFFSYFFVAMLVLSCDQLSKWWAVQQLTYESRHDFFQSDAAIADTFETMSVQEDNIANANGLFSWQRSFQHFLYTQHPLPKQSIVVMPCCFHFSYVENPGAAWGFLAQKNYVWRTPFFLSMSVIAMVVLLRYFSQTQPQEVFLRLAFMLISGGAIGNFLDRLRLGYVIDFIDWHAFDYYHWPTFNVADAAITVGVLMLLIDMLRHKPVAQPLRSEDL